MSGRNNQLQELIRQGLTDQAIAVVRHASDYREAEGFVSIVLADEKSPQELVEAVLEAFLGSRENCYTQHGYWVHSLSHFTGSLWKRRMDSWIKKFNEVAFKGASELRDPNCSDRLVAEFAAYAKWDDDPADFHLTAENLRWMDWEYAGYAKARIAAGRFESEEDFLRWKLQQPAPTSWSNDAQANLVVLDKVRSVIQRLKELGADTSEFSNLERDLLTKQLNELEGELSAAPTTEDWKRRREALEKGIQKTRAALAELA